MDSEKELKDHLLKYRNLKHDRITMICHSDCHLYLTWLSLTQLYRTATAIERLLKKNLSHQSMILLRSASELYIHWKYIGSDLDRFRQYYKKTIKEEIKTSTDMMGEDLSDDWKETLESLNEQLKGFEDVKEYPKIGKIISELQEVKDVYLYPYRYSCHYSHNHPRILEGNFVSDQGKKLSKLTRQKDWSEQIRFSICHFFREYYLSIDQITKN